jgi:hypothetical protein
MNPTNPISALEHKFMRGKIKFFFPLLKDIANIPLSLYSYLHIIPHRFYSRKVGDAYYDFFAILLREEPQMCYDILREASEKLDTAFQALKEINDLKIHDQLIKRSYDKAIFINEKIHHNFLKLCEGIYANLIFIPALAQRRSLGKGEAGFDVFQRSQELKGSYLDYLSSLYHHTVRNGIGHGSILIKDEEIIYSDKKGNSETLSFDDVIRMFDDMLDACNGMAVALHIFFTLNQTILEAEGITLPKALLLEELILQTRSPRWEIIACFDSESAIAKKQLSIYTYNTFWDVNKLRLSVMESAISAELYAPDYDRYFFHLDSKHLSLGWAGFNGSALKKLRTEKSDNYADYISQALENKFIMYTPLRWYKKIFFPEFILRKNARLTVFKVGIPILRRARKEEKNSYLLYHRVFAHHRNRLRFIINGSRLVLYVKDGIDVKEFIRTNHKKIVKEHVRKSKKQCSLFSLSRYARTDYVSLSIFTEDMRQRELRYPAGHNKKMICTIDLNLSKIVQTIEPWFTTKERIGKYAIYWNDDYDPKYITE